MEMNYGIAVKNAQMSIQNPYINNQRAMVFNELRL